MGIGLVISLLLQLNQEAIDLAVVQLQVDDEGRFVETPPPARLPSHTVVVLDVYGSLFYAGSRTLQVRLPDPSGAERPAVVLRLRGRTSLGATFDVGGSRQQPAAVGGARRQNTTGMLRGPRT